MSGVFSALKGQLSKCLNVVCADPRVLVSYSLSLQAFPESSCGWPFVFVFFLLYFFVLFIVIANTDVIRRSVCD